MDRGTVGFHSMYSLGRGPCRVATRLAEGLLCYLEKEYSPGIFPTPMTPCQQIVVSSCAIRHVCHHVTSPLPRARQPAPYVYIQWYSLPEQPRYNLCERHSPRPDHGMIPNVAPDAQRFSDTPHQARVSLQHLLWDFGEAYDAFRAAKEHDEAASALRVERLKYEQGRSIINDVLDVEAALLTSESLYKEALLAEPTENLGLELPWGASRQEAPRPGAGQGE